jgi:sirohydrochlorin ferrochelatase
MTKPTTGRISDDNPQIADLRQQLQLGALMPQGTEPRRLAESLAGLPTLPDRFNQAFLDAGWIFVEFACGHEAAERALGMRGEGAGADDIDRYLAASFLGVQPIKWQALKLLGGGIAEPRFPIRAEVTERALAAYEAGDYLVAVPLILMLVDGFGVSATGTKSMFSDLSDLEEMFQSTESMAGHPSALKPLLVRLQRAQRGYSEEPLALPMRNGILHGTRLNYANAIVAAKALNLLAAVVEWARDVAPETADETARKSWNERFLRANLERLDPDSPERALDLLAAAIANRRSSDAVALIDYHPVYTLLSEKIREWRELDEFEIGIERISAWELFGADRPGQTAWCMVRLTLGRRDGTTASVTEERVFAGRSVELTGIGLTAYWQIALALLGTIRARLADA